jgi:hypothetical protein
MDHHQRKDTTMPSTNDQQQPRPGPAAPTVSIAPR